MNYFSTLNALKGIAAIIIATGHYFVWKGYEFSPAFILAVDFFFIVSGFTLTNSIFKRECSTQEYCTYLFKSRLIRLYFPYLLIALLYIVVSFIKENKADLYAAFMSLLLLQGYGFSFGESIISNSTIGICWYLSVEFYLAFLIFPIVFKMKSTVYKEILFFGFIAFICLNILVNSSPNYMNVTYERVYIGIISITFGCIRALLGYSLGILSYLSVLAVSKFKNVKKIFIIAEPVIVLLIVFAYQNGYNRFNEYVFPFLASLCVIIFANSYGYISKILNISFFQKIGVLSFSVYLLHPICISFFKNYNNYLLYIILLFFLAFLFHNTIEKICLDLKAKIKN